jgi:hypothetical protein
MLIPDGKIHLENILTWPGFEPRSPNCWSGLLHHQAVISQNEFCEKRPAVGKSGFKSLSSRLIFHMVNLVIFCLPVPRSIEPKVTEFDCTPVFSANYSETFVQGICWDRKNHDFTIGGLGEWKCRVGCVLTGAPSVLRALRCKSSKCLNLALFTNETFPWVMINNFYYLPSNTVAITAWFSICVFLIEITLFLVHSALRLIAYLVTIWN